MASENPLLLDLEQRLARDRDGSVRAGLVAELEQLLGSLRERLARGGTQEQYARWAASERAVTAALGALDRIKVQAVDQPPAGPAIRITWE